MNRTFEVLFRSHSGTNASGGRSYHYIAINRDAHRHAGVSEATSAKDAAQRMLDRYPNAYANPSTGLAVATLVNDQVTNVTLFNVVPPPPPEPLPEPTYKVVDLMRSLILTAFALYGAYQPQLPAVAHALLGLVL